MLLHRSTSRALALKMQQRHPRPASGPVSASNAAEARQRRVAARTGCIGRSRRRATVETALSTTKPERRPLTLRPPHRASTAPRSIRRLKTVARRAQLFAVILLAGRIPP